jgi:hypothetical protein
MKRLFAGILAGITVLLAGTRLDLAPQFQVRHRWKWIWYQDGSAGGVPLLSGKWVVS